MVRLGLIKLGSLSKSDLTLHAARLETKVAELEEQVESQESSLVQDLRAFVDQDANEAQDCTR